MSDVTFVPVDFSRDDAFAKLRARSLTLGESYFMGRAHARGPFIVVAECIV